MAYQGQPLGCGTGVYDTADITIVAVGDSNSGRWPCGSVVNICSDRGCIVGIRQDSCPGCDAAGVVVDLSEAGIDAVCGAPESSSCRVAVE